MNKHIVELTEEQYEIVNFIPTLLKESDYKSIGIKAFAGCGKSFVLKHIAIANPNIKILGLAFNNSIYKENKENFPKRNTKWFTIHGFARKYLQKNDINFDFSNQRKNYKDIVILDILGIDKEEIVLGKRINEVFKVYCQSSLKTIDNISIRKAIKSQMNEYLINIKDKDLIVACNYAEKLWSKFCNKDIFPTFDFYLKYFEVNKFAENITDFHLVELDEAQDSNAVTMSIINQIPAKYIFVGDEHQSIYAFRGTLNALKYTDKLFYLSTTFRYVPKIADFANKILKSYKNERILIKSLANSESSKKDNKIAYISRNNASMIQIIAECIKKEEKFVTVRKPDELFETAIAIYEFINNKIIENSKYDFLKDISDLKEYIKSSEDNELKVSFNMQQRYKGGLYVLKKIADKYFKNQKGINTILTTAHTSKGLEWDKIILVNDFPNIQTLLKNAKINNVKELLYEAKKNNINAIQIIQEINLYYVAITRARYDIKYQEINLDDLDNT